MTALRKAAPADPVRNAELAAIHTARRQLALADDTYRAIVSRFTKGRTESSGDMNARERRELIEYFRSLGFAKAAKSKSVLNSPAARRADFRPQASKLKALWYALYQLGVVHNPAQEALDAFVCRHTGIEAMRWNYPEHLNLAIECIKGWAARVGYESKPLRTLTRTPQEGSFKPGLIQAQWDRLAALGAFNYGRHAGLDTWLHSIGLKVSAPCFLNDDDAEEVIKRLGHWIRRLTKAEAGDD